MKYCLLLLSFFTFTLRAQTTKTEFDGHKWEAPYHLPIPKDWTIERFLIPISFAPRIPYTGVEDIRFTPGWGDAKSDQYWTYAFGWYLDGAITTNAKTIATHLQDYYSGLLKVNSDSTKIAKENLPAVTASFEKITTAPDDLETWSGTIQMVDYMQLKPLTLHCLAHRRSCPGENKTILFYQLSPKPFTHSNWKSLHQLWAAFTCKKNDGDK